MFELTIEEFIIKRFQVFFLLVTLILTAQFIIGNVLAPEQVLHYSDLLSPVIMAALCMIPTFVTYSKKELSVPQMFFRMVIQLIMIETIILTLAALSSEVGPYNFPVLAILAGTVFIIYVIIMLVLWVQQYFESQKMTEQLKKFQNMYNNERE